VHSNPASCSEGVGFDNARAIASTVLKVFSRIRQEMLGCSLRERTKLLKTNLHQFKIRDTGTDQVHGVQEKCLRNIKQKRCKGRGKKGKAIPVPGHGGP
jgi:hypothetical protein